MAKSLDKRRFSSHGGDVWGFSRKHNVPVDRILDFSAPINFLGPSPKSIEAVKKFSEFIKFYPDPNPIELKKEISEYVKGVNPENIIVGNGSIELIYIFAEYFSPSFKAVIPVPSFTEYEKAILRAGGEPVMVKMPEDFSLDVGKLEKVVSDGARIVFVCNPHSPSGRLYEKEKMLELIDFCRSKNVFVFVDENYIEFVDSVESVTLAPYVNEYDNIFVVRSLSKFFGSPGIRFGYGIGNQEFVSVLEDLRYPWSINSLAACATEAALKDTDFIAKTKLSIVKEKKQLVKMLEEVGDLKVFPSETNFLLIKILNKKITSVYLKQRLAERGILIRDCSTFYGLDDSYIRVTVRGFSENQKLIEAVKETLKPRNHT
jgi:threonine-phosphate decarboxylase